MNIAACSKVESSGNFQTKQAKEAGMRFDQLSHPGSTIVLRASAEVGGRKKSGSKAPALKKLLDELALGVADFDFAKVEFLHFVFDFRAITYGYDGDLVGMNVFLGCGLSLLWIDRVHGVREF